MQVNFLKVGLPCHCSGLLYLPCPVIFILLLGSQKEGLDPVLPLGGPQSAWTELDKVAGGTEGVGGGAPPAECGGEGMVSRKASWRRQQGNRTVEGEEELDRRGRMHRG